MIKINIITGHPLDATSFYRAFGVWNELSRGTDIQLFNDNSISWADTCKYDLLYIHRAYQHSHLDFIKTANQCGVPVWLDWDDDLINIPQHNPAYGIYKDSKMNDLLKSNAKITVSTEGMKVNYKTGEVIKNYPPIKFKPVEPRKTSKFRIMWRGSDTHQADWMSGIQAFSDFLKGKKNIEFIAVGALPFFAESIIRQYVDIRKTPIMRIYEYFGALQGGQLADMIFIPLEDNLFNRAKSDIAVQEGLLTGATSVQPFFNCELGYSYEKNLLEQLENCYADWNDNYLVQKEGTMEDQKYLLQNKELMMAKRISILENLTNFNI